MACALGILVADSSALSLWWILSLVGCFLLAYRASRLSFWLTFGLAISGYGIHKYHLASLDKQKSQNGNEISALGIITQEPRSVRNFRYEVPYQIIQSHDSPLTGSTVLLNYATTTEPQVGEKVWIKGNLKRPSPRMNPDVLDKEQLMLRRGIALELYAHQIQPTGTIARSHWVHAWAASSRLWIREQLTKGVTNEDSSKIILAMFLGEKPRNGSEIMNAFKNSGTIHVFAVSGLHVMMIGLLFTLFFRLCRAPLFIWVPLVIVIMFFYAIVTGMNPPAMRAAIMGATVLLALLLQRKPSLPNSLWLSAIIAMLWSTHCIFLPGFQLSYAVLISICLTGNWWAKRWSWMTAVDPFFPKSLFTRWQQCLYHLRHKSASTLSVSSSAWVGSSFLIWLYFGLITPIAIIASLPIMLMVFTLLTVCCLSLTLGSLSDSIAKPLNRFNGVIANTTHVTTRFFSSLDFLRYHRKRWAKDERIVIYSIPDGGAATYIGLGGGVMLDAGNSDHFYSEVWPSLRKNGAPIDSLIASHADVNHLQGLKEIIKRFEIKQLVIAKSNRRSRSHYELLDLASQHDIQVITPQRQNLPLRENASIEILDTGDPNYPLADDRCSILLLHWDGKKILFYNDSGGQSEQRMKENYPQLKADIVVLGKHGNDQSISTDTIKSLNPSHVIASQSIYPEGEHRTEQWKNALKNSGIKLFLLDQSGAITLTQENARLEVEPTN